MALDDLLPLPFRILALLVLGAWLWLLTLRIASTRNINLTYLLKLDPSTQLTTQHELRCVNVTITSVATYLLYSLLHDSTTQELTLWDVLPLFAIAWTLHQLCSPRTSRLSTSLARVFKGGINRDIRTNDIVLSDTLTSYSKVLVDLAVYICHLYNFQTCLPKNTGPTLDRKCGEQVLLDTMVGSIPNFIRLSQCMQEWRVTGDSMHLWNFLKYSSNIPVLVTGLLMRQRDGYTGIWVFFAMLNSGYSFWWDINNDWNLNLFKFGHRTVGDDWLRVKLHYDIREFYYLAIIFDFIGRFVWVAKFLPSPEKGDTIFYIGATMLFSTESGWFALEVLEILRRWVWVFIKLEVDYITLTNNKDVEMNSL